MVKVFSSSFPWFSTYFLMVSSSTCPTVPQKYPRAHICCPQYLFFNSGNSSCSKCDDLPFRYCAIWLGDIVVGHESNICTWSLLILPRTISSPFASHPCRNNSLNRIATFPCNTLYLYFVIHTKWYFISYMVWLPVLYCPILWHLASPLSFYHFQFHLERGC